MSERAAPFYCPYCGEEDLRPFGETHGQWRCGACRRVFSLKYVGSTAEWTSEPTPEPTAESRPPEGGADD